MTPDQVDSHKGWRAVASGFLALAGGYGLVYSFGPFVLPMSRDLAASKSEIGAVFSIASGLFLALGLITGPLSDRVGPKPLGWLGALLLGLGLALTARVTSVHEAYLSYGLCVGLGVACLFVPVTSNVAAWFVRYRGRALGIAVSGIGFGTLVGPTLAAWLIDRYGWRTAALSLGLGAMVLVALAATLMPRAPRPATAAGMRWSISTVLAHRDFRLIYFSGLSLGFALYVPVVFLAPYGQQQGMNSVHAAALVSVLGLSSTASRLLFGGIADRLGPVRSVQIGSWLIVASYTVWLLFASRAALLCVALLLGAGYGALVALTPVLLMHYFGQRQAGAIGGLMSTSGCFGALLGAPVAGALIASSGYACAIVVFGGVALAGALAASRLRPYNASQAPAVAPT